MARMLSIRILKRRILIMIRLQNDDTEPLSSTVLRTMNHSFEADVSSSFNPLVINVVHIRARKNFLVKAN